MLLLCIFLLFDLLAFCLYAVDKHRSRRRKRRIPERVLLWWALPGGVGALLGMLVVRHKTRHIRFLLLVPLFALLQGAVLLLYARLHGMP